MTSRTVPLPDILRLSREDVDRLHPGLRAGIETTARGGEVAQIDGWVAGQFRLPRGSIFVASEGTRAPFAFTVTVNGHRTQAVVAREYGDLSWPAWLRHQREQAVHRGRAVVQNGLRHVTDWLIASEHQTRTTEGGHLAHAP